MNIENLMELVNAKINDDARRSGVMTLGALRAALNVLPPDSPVTVDAGGSVGNLDSYRGYYERLAFEPSASPTTAAAVLAALDYADGETFQGYKGGDYEMGPHTFLHLAYYGETGTQITGLHLDAGGTAVIETAEEVF